MINSVNWPKTIENAKENSNHVENADENLSYLKNLETKDFEDFVDSFENLSKNPPISTKWLESAMDNIINETLKLSKKDGLQLLFELKKILDKLDKNEQEHIFNKSLWKFLDRYEDLLNSTDNMTPDEIKQKANELKIGALYIDVDFDIVPHDKDTLESLLYGISMDINYSSVNRFFRLISDLPDTEADKAIGNLFNNIIKFSKNKENLKKSLTELKTHSANFANNNKNTKTENILLKIEGVYKGLIKKLEQERKVS